MDKEAWHAAVHGVTKSHTWLGDWTELSAVIRNLLGTKDWFMQDSFSTDLAGESGVVQVVMQAIGSNGEQWFLFSSLKAKQYNYTRQDEKVNR